MAATLYPMLLQIGEGWPDSRPLMCTTAFTLAYACALVCRLIRNKVVRQTVFAVVFTLTVTHSALQTACMRTVGVCIDRDIVAAMLATNSNEASEFLNSFCTPEVCIDLAVLPLFLLAVAFVCKRWRPKVSPKIYCAGFIVFLACSGLTIPYFWMFRYTAVDFTRNIILYALTPQIKLHHSQAKIKLMPQRQPPLIIWIMGESLTSHHCSLCGYAKPTNPLLQRKVNSGEALLFPNVKAAELYTQGAFQLMMTTFDKSMKGKKEWYDCPFLPDIAKAAGYDTWWISNQSKHGVYDNTVGQFSELCDTSIFIGNIFSGLQRTTYDGEMLPVLKSALRQTKAKSFVFVHLMGCHAEFVKRYPATFSHFKESDYADSLSGQRYKLSAYDNAVRYNDYVVNAMFDAVKRKEAIVIYSPDHGLDVFESNPQVASHANRSNPVSVKAGHDIPFLVYMSPLFRQRNPDIVARMEKSIRRDFDLENIIYLMMDLMRCDFPTPAVGAKSLLVSP